MSDPFRAITISAPGSCSELGSCAICYEWGLPVQRITLGNPATTELIFQLCKACWLRLAQARDIAQYGPVAADHPPRPIVESDHVAHEHSIPGNPGDTAPAIAGLTFHHSHGGAAIHSHEFDFVPILPMPEEAPEQ